jgi:hypothetical protein
VFETSNNNNNKKPEATNPNWADSKKKAEDLHESTVVRPEALHGSFFIVATTRTILFSAVA